MHRYSAHPFRPTAALLVLGWSEPATKPPAATMPTRQSWLHTTSAWPYSCLLSAAGCGLTCLVVAMVVAREDPNVCASVCTSPCPGPDQYPHFACYYGMALIVVHHGRAAAVCLEDTVGCAHLVTVPLDSDVVITHSCSLCDALTVPYCTSLPHRLEERPQLRHLIMLRQHARTGCRTAGPCPAYQLSPHLGDSSSHGDINR